MNVKEILSKYQIPEDQAPSILKGLKIDKKSNDGLTVRQATATEHVCKLIKEGVPLVDALVQALDAIKQEGAIVQAESGPAMVAPPISNKTVTSLEGYAKEVIPPNAPQQFVSKALDGVDRFVEQLTPENGYRFGQAIAQKVVSELPNVEEGIQNEIQARLGERKARASA